MAKRQIKNYVFTPGIGALDYVYPDAYSLLLANRDFLLSESVAYIDQEIIDAVKCRRDVGYFIDGVAWDVALGTNYNAIFLGLTEVNSLDLSNTVYRTIARTKSAVAAVTQVSINATALSRSNAAFDEILDIAQNGRLAANTHTYTNPSTATNSRIAAKDKILANLNFLAAEINAWVDVTYPAHNHNVDKCTRDTKYALYAAAYDILYGGNSASYDSAKFFNYYAASGATGITAEHQTQTVAAYRRLQTIISNVVQGILITKSLGNAETQVVSGVNADAGDGTAVANLIDIVADVVENGVGSLPGVRTVPSITWAAAGIQSAKNAIDAAKPAIIDAVTWDPTYTYNQSKCERDLGYVLDAYLHDLRYGGNAKIKKVIKYYWEGTTAQIDGTRIPEIDTHAFIGDLITDYVLANVAYNTQGLESQVIDLTKTAEDYQFTPTAATYIPTTGLMTLTIGTHNLSIGAPIRIAEESLTFTCALDNNATLHPYPRATGVPNASGQDPYYNKPVYITAITNTTITVNIGISSDTSKHTFVSADTDAITASAAAAIDALVSNVVDVITGGLTAMPASVTEGVGSVKFQGNYSSNELLLITNTTRNEIIYNFSTAVTGGYVEIQTYGVDDDFVKYLQTTDGITTVTLNYNTSLHASTDDIQIFVEEAEVRTRPYDFGTDAIERHRVAMPQSMLDADFEYGLQPTKWSAISTLRGYPSVYELPGTDTDVLTVVTDASAGTSGVGQSRITVTTVAPHGFEPGTPISIKALKDSIIGAARAEGNFVVTTVPTTTTFTFFAKAKVGTVNGQVLSTTYTQLRKSGFYTGASIGRPTFSISSNGSSGSVTTVLDTLAGNSIFAFSGSPPELGSPLVNANIPLGSQVTAINGSGGTVATKSVAVSAEIGDSSIELVNTSGIVPNLAVNRGDGTAMFVTSVVGNTLNFSDEFTTRVIANSAEYTNIPGNNESSNGVGATFDVTVVPGEGLATVAVGTSGINYSQGLTATVSAPNSVGGIQATVSLSVSQATGEITGYSVVEFGSGYTATPTVALVKPTTITRAGTGVILTTTITLASTTGIYVGMQVTGSTGLGTGNAANSVIVQQINSLTEITVATAHDGAVTGTLTFADIGTSGVPGTRTLTSTGGSYAMVVGTAGTGFNAGDRILINGNTLGGRTVVNDALVIVSTVDVSGGITAITHTGVPFTGVATLTGITGTTSGGFGTLGSFDVTWENNIFTGVTVSSGGGGSGYIVGDRIKILGSFLYPIGGADGTHDLYLTVDTVDGSGQILTVTWLGTAPNAIKSFNTVAYTTSGLGINAVVNVSFTGTAYSVAISPRGIDFQDGDTITVLGANIGGVTPDNNLVITVNGVNPLTGEIVSFGWTGTAKNAASTLSAAGDILVGSGAIFTVALNAGVYSVTVTEGGDDYAPGQQIVISGANLIGLSPANDLTISISSTDTFRLGFITAVTRTGTAVTSGGPYLDAFGNNQQNTGFNARFNVTRASSAYSNIQIAIAGSGYNIGNRITILGTILEGTSPTNNIVITVTNVNGTGGITSISTSSSAASAGTTFDIISTIVMTELTSGVMLNGSSVTFSALATIEVNFANPHGLVPGDTFIVTVTSNSGSNNHLLAAGSYFATIIPSITSLRYQARAPGAIDAATNFILGTVYPRPDSFFTHRPFDGGVQLGTGGPQHGAQAIRQSKKYIRYQSGKGIMYTTGALFAPSYDLRSVVSEGIEVNSLITVVTDDNDHGLQVGGVIRLLGIETAGYNSGNETASPPIFDYTVVDVVDERTFKVRAQRRLGSTTADLGFGAQMSVVAWHGATVRSGIFDDQNGIYWEYDGTNISVNQRTGTRQLAGTGAINVDENIITGTNSKYRDQVKAGDRIVIKGMTHVVSHVISQTSMAVTPDFRGVVNISGAKIMLVVDKKVKQEDFNLDRLDGTGPSGYNIDIAKMQMIGIQYSWYGAGFIDFMLRGSNGNFVFCHRMRNSNVNTEAFMRSGNLPVRYEVTNEGPPGKLSADMTSVQTYIDLEDSSFFPTEGTVYIDNEIITFNGRTGNRLTGCTRSAPFSTFQAGADRTYSAGVAVSHLDKTGVILISNTITPLISHWGSAFLTDGMFDEDRGYIFSYAEKNIAISTTRQTAFMIRLSPSVSNAITGDLGERELLNRAQLLLQGLEITSDAPTTAQAGGIVIEGILNPNNYPLNPSDVGWTKLSGLAQGGQPSFSQVAAGGSVVWSSGASATLATATASAIVSTQLDSGLYNPGNNQGYVFVSGNDYRATFGSADLTPVVGRSITGTGIRTGTTITGGFIPTGSGDNYGYFTISQTTNNNINPGTTNAFTVTATGNLVNRNIVWLNKASFEATAAKVGTTVSTGSSITVPANTTVNAITLRTFAGTQYYEVQLSSTYTGTFTAGTSTITFSFVQPPFAQPGETVFSFIATPGERATLDLAQLKELTNTPLGGRGTFPNGPDVLAINVYKVSGDAVVSNIILRWGEAQA
jgi:hypothetical protein